MAIWHSSDGGFLRAEGPWTAQDVSTWEGLGRPALCVQVTKEGPATLDFLRDCAGLEWLIVLGEPVDANALAECVSLKELRFTGQAHRPLNLANLSNLEVIITFVDAILPHDAPGLRQLEMTWRNHDVQSLLRYSGLTGLELNAGRLESPRELALLPNLNYLGLFRARRLSRLDFLPSGSIQRLCLQGCTSLLTCDGVEILSELQEIYLVGCTNVQTVAHLTKVPTLKRVNIEGTTDVRDGALAQLLTIPSLRYISVEPVRAHYDLTRQQLRESDITLWPDGARAAATPR